jgi:hypothetical protein
MHRTSLTALVGKLAYHTALSANAAHVLAQNAKNVTATEREEHLVEVAAIHNELVAVANRPTM